jgi:two-component system, LytTR family, response regulator
MPIRVAIVDDEPLAIELLADYVQKTPGLILTEATTDVFKVLKMVQEGVIDLVLLDVQMPQLTGIQFLKISGEKCSIILTTAYTEYALDGYEYNIIDYLLKPISYERFFKAIEKLKARQTATPEDRTPSAPDHLFIKSEYKLIRVKLDEITYIESLRDYIALHTTTQGKIMSLESMNNMEELLPSSRFTRIHKSYIIALDKIAYIEKNSVGIAGQVLPIGNTYKENFSRLIEKK